MEQKYKNQDQIDSLVAICNEAKLTKDDIFTKAMPIKNEKKELVGYSLMLIVKRQGISKLQDHFHIKVKVEEKHIERYTYKDSTGKEYVGWDVWMYGTGYVKKDNKTKEVWSYSSANHKNCSNEYVVETCEKRLKARIVLELADLYQHGVFSEDESNDFEENQTPTKDLENRLKTDNPKLGQPK
jgi:hypothetical protein